MGFVCHKCGMRHPKWSGQCVGCQEWNSLVPQQDRREAETPIQPQQLSAVDAQQLHRLQTNCKEFDRVLGGGIVPGSVILLGGDPGIGKSTLLLQTMAEMGKRMPVLYVSGEESLEQLALRGKRLGQDVAGLLVVAETRLQAITQAISDNAYSVVVIDSIQTMTSPDIAAAAGSVSQVRESSASLLELAKKRGCSIILVGHVTKEGTIAGPRILEHMVDAVLYFEGDRSSSLRLVRAIKNRFGAVNEIAVFAMTESGLKEVGNPSALFINRRHPDTYGSAILTTIEGTRPLLVEVQALVEKTHAIHPRRLSVGVDPQRLAMLLAVLHRYAGIDLVNHDVFINVVSGIRISETAADVTILLALISSYHSHPLDIELASFGEVGLSGEVRPVQRGGERINEAGKLGMRSIILPAANKPKKAPTEVILKPLRQVSELLAIFS